jgi:hypothetical protein
MGLIEATRGQNEYGSTVGGRIGVERINHPVGKPLRRTNRNRAAPAFATNIAYQLLVDTIHTYRVLRRPGGDTVAGQNAIATSSSRS